MSDLFLVALGSAESAAEHSELTGAGPVEADGS
jgi:hypothetical protein